MRGKNSAGVTADIAKLSNDLRNAASRVDRSSEDILDVTAYRVETLMKQYAPVKTGRLYMSIRTVSSPGKRDIGPHGVDYAVYQEFGTATRGVFGGQEYIIKPKSPGGRLHFQVNGKWVSAKEVRHPGIPPHPFAGPAARQALDEIGDTYARMGVDLIVKGNFNARA